MASLLDRWKEKNKLSESSEITISKAPIDATIPLSHGQRQLWFLQQLYPDNPFYNYAETFLLSGNLNIDFFQKAVKQVVKDHDILRTVFHENNDQPIQKTTVDVEMVIGYYDYSKIAGDDLQKALSLFAIDEGQTKFSLKQGPLFKFSIIKRSDFEHQFFLTFHHIVMDAWSMMLFRNQIAEHYKNLIEGKPLISLKSEIQYGDFAYHGQKLEINEDDLEYWKKKLSGNLPKLKLPFDHDRPPNPSYMGAMVTEKYAEELSEALLTMAKDLGVTAYVLLLSAYYVLLFKFSAQKDICIGTPITNRDQKELEHLIGYFVDTIVLREKIPDGIEFSNFVKQVQKTSLEAFTHKKMPFDVLVKTLQPKRSLNINPIFQAMFVYNKGFEKPSFGSDVTMQHMLTDVGVSKFDFTLHVNEDEGMLAATMEYASDLFEEDTIRTFQDDFKSILNAIVANKDIAVERLFRDHSQLVDVNEIKESNFKGIHGYFEEVVQKYPEKPALTFQENSISYKELDESANLVAKNIIVQTKGENQIVGLCLDRSIEMIIGLLGILKAGCAYLPIDPEYPERRIQFMVSDADVNLILTQEKQVPLLKDAKSMLLLFEACNDLVQVVELPKVSKDSMAYVIYTSGSSGKPKGVPISHHNIISSTIGRFDFYENQPSAFLLLSSIAFDSSKAGLFWTLCSGGNLVISEPRLEQDMQALKDVIRLNRVTHTLMLPSLYDMVLDHIEISSLISLDTVIVAGETCTSSTALKHFEKLPKTNLYNEYGPTEATVWCLAHKIVREDIQSSIPIGKSVAGAIVYLLDEDLNQVEKGEKGEIYVGGPGLSGTYLNRTDLTNIAYVKNPFNETDGSMFLYKTGDLAKYGQNDCIEFLGRKDQQVKIRGHRIEVEEIASVLKGHKSIKQAEVIVENGNAASNENMAHEKQDEGNRGAHKLVAYLTTKKSEIKVAEVTSFLRGELPDYMVPSAIHVLEEMPLLPNGKVDRKALKAKMTLLGVSQEEKDEVQIPKTRIEEKLLLIWEEVLKVSPISVNDNFFEIGGDSILSIQLISKARKSGIMLTANQLFEHQTIAELSTHLAKELNGIIEKYEYITPLRKEGGNTPLFCIHSGGGHVFFYKLLAKHMKPNRPIYAIHPSGLYRNEKMHYSVEEMGRDYLTAIQDIQPTGPYNILVHCFSTSVGHEIAVQLSKTDEKVNIIVADNMASPWNATSEEVLRIRRLYFLKRLSLSPIKTVWQFFVDRMYMLEPLYVRFFGKDYQKELERLKANLRSMSVAYRGWDIKQKGQVSLLLTDKPDQRFQNLIIDSWKAIALGGVKIFPVQGKHNSLFEEPDVGLVSKAIDKSIIEG